MDFPMILGWFLFCEDIPWQLEWPVTSYHLIWWYLVHLVKMPKLCQKHPKAWNLNLGPKVHRMTPLYKEIEQEMKPLENDDFWVVFQGSPLSLARRPGEGSSDPQIAFCRISGLVRCFCRRSEVWDVEFPWISLGAVLDGTMCCDPRSLRMVMRRP